MTENQFRKIEIEAHLNILKKIRINEIKLNQSRITKIINKFIKKKC